MDVVKRSQLQNLIIYIGDVIGITIGYFLVTYLKSYDFGILRWIYDFDVYYRWLVVVLAVTLAYLLLYPNKGFFKRKFKSDIIYNLKTNAFIALCIAAVAFLMEDVYYSRFIWLMTIVFSFCWMQISHCVYRWYILKYRKPSQLSRQMLIITTSERAEKVVRNVIKEKEWNIWVTGIIIIDCDMIGQTIMDIPVVADYRTMYLYSVRSAVDEVFIHLSENEEFPIDAAVSRFEDMGIKVNLHIPLFELKVDSSRELDQIGKYYAVAFGGREISLRKFIAKRALDIVGGVVGLILTALATIIVGPLIKLESPGPIFFSQNRVGRNGRIFKIYKFRSMYADAEERKKELMEQNEMEGLMFKIKDDPRITKVGKFIRKTSIDELPQFWNVLKGDMSLVGTRPPTVDEFEQYDEYHKKRLSMTPGLTGVWQVSGRSDIKDFEEVVKMDVEYIDNWSLKRDIQIIFKTVQIVLSSASGAR